MTVDLWDPVTLQDPYPLYEELRSVPPGKGPLGWLFLDYADVSALLVEPSLSSRRPELDIDAIPHERSAAESLLRRHSEGWFLRMDHPEHTRLRRLSRRAFSNERIAALGPAVDATVADLVATIRSGEVTDLISEVAFKLPTLVMAQLLDVPKADRQSFLTWSDQVEKAYDKGPDWSALVERPPRDVTGLASLCDYLTALVEDRRRTPVDDFLGMMVASEHEGDRMATVEIVATCVMLIRTGRETTTNLIGNGMLALLRHQDQFHQLRENRTLLPGAIREFLRYDSPLQIEGRTALAPVSASGVTIDPGDVVMLGIGAANRDPKAFVQPARFDLRRQDRSGSLSFGRGPHVCIAANLALRQAHSTFTALLDAFSGAQLASDDLTWGRNPSLRGVRALPVLFEL